MSIYIDEMRLTGGQQMVLTKIHCNSLNIDLIDLILREKSPEMSECIIGL